MDLTRSLVIDQNFSLQSCGIFFDYSLVEGLILVVHISVTSSHLVCVEVLFRFPGRAVEQLRVLSEARTIHSFLPRWLISSSDRLHCIVEFNVSFSGSPHSAGDGTGRSVSILSGRIHLLRLPAGVEGHDG
jgi:hypothetical protein